jgi:hypothetical protein
MPSTPSKKEHTMKRTAATLALVLSVAATAVGTASASTPNTSRWVSRPSVIHGGSFHGGSWHGGSYHGGSLHGGNLKTTWSGIRLVHGGNTRVSTNRVHY